MCSLGLRRAHRLWIQTLPLYQPMDTLPLRPSHTSLSQHSSKAQCRARRHKMGQLVADLPEVGACVARRFYEHAGAHLATSGEDSSVEALIEDFVASDYDFQSLVVALVTNDGFRYALPAVIEEPAVGDEEAGQ